MTKVTFRIDEKLLQQIDAKVDQIWVKNRSQAIIKLIKKSLGIEKTAVILARGPGHKYGDFRKNIRIGNAWNSTTRLKQTALIEEQIKILYRYGFTIVYIVTLEEAINDIKNIFRDEMETTIHYVPIHELSRSAESLRLLKKRIRSNFLVIFADVLFNIDLQELYEVHLNNDAVATLVVMSHPTPQMKGGVKLEGRKITHFDEKIKHPEHFMVFEPVFMCSPKIFDIEGESLIYDIFPKMAQRSMLQAFPSTGHIAHLHEKKDIKALVKLLS